MGTDVKIQVALSWDKVHILVKILAESHSEFDLGDKIDIRWHTHRHTNQPI